MNVLDYYLDEVSTGNIEDKHFRNKEKKNLSSFKMLKLTDVIINKYKTKEKH